jgi:xanthine dehydrogenase molybdopterin-binding subunit B
MWNGMMPDYHERLNGVDEFNKNNAFVKRGLSANTVKYEVSQGKNAATVSVYPDGSIICHHDGAEMGQVNCHGLAVWLDSLCAGLVHESDASCSIHLWETRR